MSANAHFVVWGRQALCCLSPPPADATSEVALSFPGAFQEVEWGIVVTVWHGARVALALNSTFALTYPLFVHCGGHVVGLLARLQRMTVSKL